MADKTISGLTALPGTLGPAAILAIVQSGVTYRATGQQVADMVLGNISVIENANGISFSFPGSRLRILYRYSVSVSNVAITTANTPSGTFRSSQQVASSPQNFADAVPTIPLLHANTAGVFALPGAPTHNQFTYSLYASGSIPAFSGTISFLAIGKY